MDINELKSRVAAQTTVIAGAVELLKGLHTKLDDAIKANDPAALQAVADEIKANTDTLASAVQENTPSSPTPTPTPESPPTQPPA